MRQLRDALEVLRYAHATSLPVVKVLARGNSDCWVDLRLIDGTIRYYHPTGEVQDYDPPAWWGSYYNPTLSAAQTLALLEHLCPETGLN